MIRCSCGAELFSIESICSVCIPSKPPRALFVEDLRIKLANRELEILDWKEAAEIANAENDDLRREVAATTKHAQLLNKMLGEADARAERLRVAIEETVRTMPEGSRIHVRLTKALEAEAKRWEGAYDALIAQRDAALKDVEAAEAQASRMREALDTIITSSSQPYITAIARKALEHEPAP